MGFLVSFRGCCFFLCFLVLMVLWICPCCYNYQHTRELISALKTSHKSNNSLVYWFCTSALGLILFQIRVVIADKFWFWYPFRSSIRYFDTRSINLCLLDKSSQMAQTACGRLFHPNIGTGTAASSLQRASPDEEALIGWINWAGPRGSVGGITSWVWRWGGGTPGCTEWGQRSYGSISWSGRSHHISKCGFCIVFYNLFTLK